MSMVVIKGLYGEYEYMIRRPGFEDGPGPYSSAWEIPISPSCLLTTRPRNPFPCRCARGAPGILPGARHGRRTRRTGHGSAAVR